VKITMTSRVSSVVFSACLLLGFSLVSSVVLADYLDTACGTDADGDGVANSWRTQTYGYSCYSNEPINRSCWHWAECMSLTRDNCPSVSNSGQLNTDGDSQGNACDADDDNDGVADASDEFPLDASESVDTDGDGVGDNADNCPSTSNAAQTDTDGDGTGDACDAFPSDPAEMVDTDGDGVGDNSDNCPSVAIWVKQMQTVTA
jgi:hypothetical protein